MRRIPEIPSGRKRQSGTTELFCQVEPHRGTSMRNTLGPGISLGMTERPLWPRHAYTPTHQMHTKHIPPRYMNPDKWMETCPSTTKNKK